MAEGSRVSNDPTISSVFVNAISNNNDNNDDDDENEDDDDDDEFMMEYRSKRLNG